MQELDDIDTKFKLVTAGHPVVMLDDLGPRTRRPQRSSAYSLLKQVGHPAMPTRGLQLWPAAILCVGLWVVGLAVPH